MCKKPRCSAPFYLPSVLCFDLSACPQWSNCPRCLVLSPTDLCDSLYGLSFLASEGCYRRAVQENENPLSPAGMFQSLEIDLWNGSFLGSPLEWCQTWGHPAAQVARQLERRPSTSLLQRRGSSPRRPTANITLFTWLESDVRELKEVMCAYTCLPWWSWLRFLLNQSNKNKIALWSLRSTVLLCLAQTIPHNPRLKSHPLLSFF